MIRHPEKIHLLHFWKKIVSSGTCPQNNSDSKKSVNTIRGGNKYILHSSKLQALIFKARQNKVTDPTRCLTPTLVKDTLGMYT
jgi:hypothetical protein